MPTMPPVITQFLVHCDSYQRYLMYLLRDWIFDKERKVFQCGHSEKQYSSSIWIGEDGLQMLACGSLAWGG